MHAQCRLICLACALRFTRAHTPQHTPQRAHTRHAQHAQHHDAGVPGVLAALSLAYVSNLFGSMTHYGSGQAAVYYGAGYLTLAQARAPA